MTVTNIHTWNENNILFSFNLFFFSLRSVTLFQCVHFLQMCFCHQFFILKSAFSAIETFSKTISKVIIFCQWNSIGFRLHRIRLKLLYIFHLEIVEMLFPTHTHTQNSRILKFLCFCFGHGIRIDIIFGGSYAICGRTNIFAFKIMGPFYIHTYSIFILLQSIHDVSVHSCHNFLNFLNFLNPALEVHWSNFFLDTFCLIEFSNQFHYVQYSKKEFNFSITKFVESNSTDLIINEFSYFYIIFIHWVLFAKKFKTNHHENKSLILIKHIKKNDECVRHSPKRC